MTFYCECGQPLASNSIYERVSGLCDSCIKADPEAANLLFLAGQETAKRSGKECQGSCNHLSGHKGKVSYVHVFGSNRWPFGYWYCEAAIALDQASGFRVYAQPDCIAPYVAHFDKVE